MYMYCYIQYNCVCGSFVTETSPVSHSLLNKGRPLSSKNVTVKRTGANAKGMTDHSNIACRFNTVYKHMYVNFVNLKLLNFQDLKIIFILQNKWIACDYVYHTHTLQCADAALSATHALD